MIFPAGSWQKPRCAWKERPIRFHWRSAERRSGGPCCKCWDEGGRCRQSLTVLLVKPLSLSREIISAEAEGAPDGEVLWRHVFSDEEIQDYLAVSGDANEIHRGKRAVVPGLCFLERLLSSLDEDGLRWRCKFRKPVYAGEELCLVETAAGIEGYVGGRLVNTIERLPYKERVHDEINNI